MAPSPPTLVPRSLATAGYTIPGQLGVNDFAPVENPYVRLYVIAPPLAFSEKWLALNVRR